MNDDDLLGDLLSDARAVVRRLLDEPLLSEATLRAALEVYEHTIGNIGGSSLHDQQIALQLIETSRAWLIGWDGLDARPRRLVQVAIRYFVMEDDGDGDLRSPFGFDDDLEVFNAVAHALGRPPLHLG